MQTSIDFIDPTTAGTLGAHALRSCPEKVSLTALPNETLKICLKRQPNEMWKMAAAMFVGAIFSFVAMWSLDRFRWGDDVRLQLFGKPSTAFAFMGFALLGIGILHMLLLVTAGRDGDCVLEISPGRIKIDRYVAGDHVVREYSAEEIRRVAVMEGAVVVVIPSGEIVLAASMPITIQIALVGVMAVGLWQDSAFLTPNLRVGSVTIPLSACDINRVAPAEE